MSAVVAGSLGIALTLLAVAWGAYWKSRFHRAKAEVYREFANTFSAMGALAWTKDKERKKAEQKRLWMSLVLCDPVTADALRDALDDADRHWRRVEARTEDRVPLTIGAERSDSPR